MLGMKSSLLMDKAKIWALLGAWPLRVNCLPQKWMKLFFWWIERCGEAHQLKIKWSLQHLSTGSKLGNSWNILESHRCRVLSREVFQPQRRGPSVYQPPAEPHQRQRVQPVDMPAERWCPDCRGLPAVVQQIPARGRSFHFSKYLSEFYQLPCNKKKMQLHTFASNNLTPAGIAAKSLVHKNIFFGYWFLVLNYCCAFLCPQSWTAIPESTNEAVLSGQQYWVATGYSTGVRAGDGVGKGLRREVG